MEDTQNMGLHVYQKKEQDGVDGWSQTTRLKLILEDPGTGQCKTQTADRG